MADATAVIYRTLVTTQYRTKSLMTFYNSIGDGINENSIYLSIGKTDQWAANENDSSFAPPYPDDSNDGLEDVWANSQALIKVPQSQLRMVIPRQDWGDPSLDDSFNFQIGDIVITNSNANNKHPSALDGYMVYKCVDVPDDGSCSLDNSSETYEKTACISLGGTWTAESTPGQTSNIPHQRKDGEDTGDGYVWNYLYTIPPSEVITNVSDDYIVSPFPEDIRDNSEAWGLENIIQHDYEIEKLVYTVGSYKLRFRSRIDGDIITGLPILTTSGYRQLAIILNPLINAELDDTAEKATDDQYLTSEVTSGTGEMICIQNRQPIIKSADQVEEFDLIFEF